MRKTTGRVVSLVLSLALVATSFSTNFAFAATKTVSGSVDLKEDDAKVLYMVNGGTKDSQVNQTRVDLTAWINTQSKTGVTMDTTDHQDVSVKGIIDVSHVSGDKLLKWGTEEGNSIDEEKDTWLTLKSGSEDGSEVLSILYKGTYTNNDGDEVIVKARTNVTVSVLDYGTVIVGKAYSTGDITGTFTAANRVGKSIKAIDDFAQKSDSIATVDGIADVVDKHEIGVYYAVPSATDAAASYVYQSVALSSDTSAVKNAAGFTISASGNVDKLKLVKDGSQAGKIAAYVTKDVKVGNISFTASHTSSGVDMNAALAQNVSKDKVTAKAKVANKVLAKQFLNIGKDKNTYLYNGSNSSQNTTRIDVTGYDINFAVGSGVVTVDDKSSSVGKITGNLGSIDVKAGSVSAIDLDSGNVTVDNAKVGNITTDNGGTVKVDGGSVGSIDASGAVVVNSGTTGDIKSGSNIDVNGNDDEVTTSVGAITCGADTTIDSSSSKVSFKSYKAKSDSAKLILKGDNVTSGKIDFDYRDNTVLSFDDFQGKVSSPVNAAKATIETTNEDDDVVFTGSAKVDTVDVADGSKVSFDSDITAEYVSGSGTLKVLAGKLYIIEGVSGNPILKITNDFKVGDTAFKADSDAVEADDFETFGFTLTKSEGSSTDTFKIATVNFAGLVITGGSAEIAKGSQYAQTFTAVAYPTGTSIPSGDKIAWEFDGNENNFKFTSNANGTATVEVINVDASFASENKGTLTAKLVDAEGYDDSDYDAVTKDVTAVAVPQAVSDTNAALSVAKNASYTMKVTSASAPAVTAGTGGVFTITLVSKNGNDYFYKLTATGDAGKSTGIYLNNRKIFVATVKAFAFTSDTTVNTSVKGAYTFKINSATAPAVGLGTSGVFNLALVSRNGNDYFYKITSVGAKGVAAGVYVNGAKIFVATVG